MNKNTRIKLRMIKKFLLLFGLKEEGKLMSRVRFLNKAKPMTIGIKRSKRLDRVCLVFLELEIQPLVKFPFGRFQFTSRCSFYRNPS